MQGRRRGVFASNGKPAGDAAAAGATAPRARAETTDDAENGADPGLGPTGAATLRRMGDEIAAIRAGLDQDRVQRAVLMRHLARVADALA